MIEVHSDHPRPASKPMVVDREPPLKVGTKFTDCEYLVVYQQGTIQKLLERFPVEVKDISDIGTGNARAYNEAVNYVGDVFHALKISYVDECIRDTDYYGVGMWPYQDDDIRVVSKEMFICPKHNFLLRVQHSFYSMTRDNRDLAEDYQKLSHRCAITNMYVVNGVLDPFKHVLANTDELTKAEVIAMISTGIIPRPEDKMLDKALNVVRDKWPPEVLAAAVQAWSIQEDV